MEIKEVFACLCVSDAQSAVEFYTRAFGVTEKFRLTEPGGRICHAELGCGPVTVMLSDEFPECGIRSASSIGETPVTINLHVDNADRLVEQAVLAGATLERAARPPRHRDRSPPRANTGRLLGHAYTTPGRVRRADSCAAGHALIVMCRFRVLPVD